MSDMKTIVLAYRRVPGDLSSGSVLLDTGTAPPQVLRPFEALDFKVMMREFAIELLAHPDAGAAIQRTDRPGLVRIPLAPDEIELFRRDPAEAIRQRTVPPQRVVIGVDRAAGPDKTAVHVVKPDGTVLDAGYDSLAQCFGDVVYARARTKDGKPEVECHCCGSWCTIERGSSFTCWDCNQQLPIADLALASGWAGVKVRELLATCREVFFLPRQWSGKNWVPRAELEHRFNEYNKEKTS